MAFVWGLLIGLVVAVAVAVAFTVDRRSGGRRRAAVLRGAVLAGLVRDLQAAGAELSRRDAHVGELEHAVAGLEATVVALSADAFDAAQRAADVASRLAEAEAAREAAERGAAEAEAAREAAERGAAEAEAAREAAERGAADRGGGEGGGAEAEASAGSALWELELVRLERDEAMLAALGGPAPVAGAGGAVGRILAGHLEHVREEVGTPADLSVGSALPALTPAASLALARLALEIIATVAKFADHLDVDLGADGDVARIRIAAHGWERSPLPESGLRRIAGLAPGLQASVRVELGDEPLIATVEVRGLA
ncbi:MAG: hypothetical protein IPM45_02695 [Acidimicrobiales bacterium]|nr:hypothetical protein [Acidimicrobiales bacterium]